MNEWREQLTTSFFWASCSCNWCQIGSQQFFFFFLLLRVLSLISKCIDLKYSININNITFHVLYHCFLCITIDINVNADVTKSTATQEEERNACKCKIESRTSKRLWVPTTSVRSLRFTAESVVLLSWREETVVLDDTFSDDTTPEEVRDFLVLPTTSLLPPPPPLSCLEAVNRGSGCCLLVLLDTWTVFCLTISVWILEASSWQTREEWQKMNRRRGKETHQNRERLQNRHS